MNAKDGRCAEEKGVDRGGHGGVGPPWIVPPWRVTGV